MTYVERMTMKIMGEIGYNYGNQAEITQIIQQIMADDRAACLKAIEPFSRFQHMNYLAYVEAIEGAEVKEQEK